MNYFARNNTSTLTITKNIGIIERLDVLNIGDGKKMAFTKI